MITLQPPAGEGGYAVTMVDALSSSPLVIPGGNLLLTAEFVRQGPDLLLVGADGHAVLVRGYFAVGTPPDLVTVNGARVPGDLAVHLAGPMGPGQVAQLGTTATEEAIGKVEAASGTVFVVHADG